MKTTTALKDLSVLSSGAGQITGRTVPTNGDSRLQQIPEEIRHLNPSPVGSAESFYELLSRRYITPLPSESSYRSYGINE